MRYSTSSLSSAPAKVDHAHKHTSFNHQTHLHSFITHYTRGFSLLVPYVFFIAQIPIFLSYI